MPILGRRGRARSSKTALTTCVTYNKLNVCLYGERCH